MTPEDARAWFFPRSLLVAGVSKQRAAQGNLFIRRQRQFGYDGPIYVLHPEGGTAEGEPCFRSIAEVPGNVDFGFIAVPAAGVPGLVDSLADRVKVLQIMSSGFQEVGQEGRSLQDAMIESARRGHIRIVGPNCFGTYSPGGHITMWPDALRQSGDLAFVAQSGGLSCEVIALAATRGLRFSQIVALGNCADIDTVEVLDHFLQDPGVNAVGMYLEEVHRPREFLRLLQEAEGRKPIVLLKGGRTAEGQRAAKTHTGSLAMDAKLFAGIAAQFGVVLVDSPEALVDALSVLPRVARRPARQRSLSVHPRCALVGPGGGLGVLTVDTFNQHGLSVPEFSAAVKDGLASAGLPVEGSGTKNPLDVSVMTLSAQDAGFARRLFQAIAASGEVDWIVAHVHLPNLYELTPNPDAILENHLGGLTAIKEHYPDIGWAYVLRSSGDARWESQRAKLRDQAVGAGIPVFERLTDVATAIQAMHRFGRHRHRVASPLLVCEKEGRE